MANPRRQDDAAGAGSDDNMDIDDFFIPSDDDDDNFVQALDNPPPTPPPLPRNPGGVAPRTRSQDRIMNPPEFLFGLRTTRFLQGYRVMASAHLESRGHASLEHGGKLVLPPDALERLSRNSSALMRPMMFKVTNQSNRKATHCGVLEFIAEPNTCYMPRWMMDFLGVNDYDMIQVERVELPTATFVKFEPQSVDFLEISDPRAVLENTLRHFSCLTTGDIVAFHYNSKVYQLCVLETRPREAVSIVECDMDVDFAPPVGYVSPSASTNFEDSEEVAATFAPFGGSGNRLNGKNVQGPAAAAGTSGKGTSSGGGSRGAPDTDWELGSIRFTRRFRKAAKGGTGQDQKFTAFGGTGMTLRSAKKSSDTDDFSDGL